MDLKDHTINALKVQLADAHEKLTVILATANFQLEEKDKKLAEYDAIVRTLAESMDATKN